jgi:hypothetical protein
MTSSGVECMCLFVRFIGYIWNILVCEHEGKGLFEALRGK